MSGRGRSKRIIDALNQLQQFAPARRANEALAVNLLTGTSVSPVASDDDDDEAGMLFVRFLGGESFEVNGDLYLELQITESARLIIDGPTDGSGIYAKQSAADAEHLRRKHNIA